MKKLLLLVIATLWANASFAIELMTWERLPLKIKLKVNEERVIFVDKNVRVGMAPETAAKLKAQSAGGTVYLRAVETIGFPVRVQFQVADSGEVIIVDVETVATEESLEPIRIVDAKMILAQQTETEKNIAAAASTVQMPAPVALTRYAAQSLYAPMRTVEAVPGLRRAGLQVSGRLRLMPTTAIVGTPLMAWRLGEWTVSAVTLTNTSEDVVPLDPRKLQGHFYAATFQHAYLGAAGSADDTTVVYLITHRGGLEKALLPSAMLEVVPPGESR